LKNQIKIKGFLFDLDGTLIQSMHQHFLAWKLAFKKYGVKIKKNDYYYLEGSKLNEIVKTISTKKSFLNPDIESIIKYKESIYNSKAKIKFYFGVIKFIDKLINKKIKFGIVTAGQRERLYSSLPKRFLNKFDVLITGNDTKKGKPHPDPYLLGCKLLGLSNKECIVVENAPLGIKSAKEAGIFCIGISSTVEKSLLKEADIVIEKFDDLLKLEIIKNYV